MTTGKIHDANRRELAISARTCPTCGQPRGFPCLTRGRFAINLARTHKRRLIP